MEKVNLCLLNGFLGKPKDFQLLVDQLNQLIPLGEVIIPDYFNDESDLKVQNINQWKRNLFHQLEPLLSSPCVAVGYSMGGRLLQEFNASYPELFKASIVISSQSLEFTEEERGNRDAFNSLWSSHFLNMPWEDLMNQWNSLSVFNKMDQVFERQECDYSRSLLAESFHLWSPHRLQVYGDRNTLFLCGMDDKKYYEQYKMSQKHWGESQFSVIENMGHRFLKQPPHSLVQILSNYIQEKI